MRRGLVMYFLDLFSGIGGFALGAKWAGLEFDKHYFSEVDDYAIKVYKKHFPKAIALWDITKIDYARLPNGAWYVSGGFPCQPHSSIGKRKAANDERDLWPECARMLRELRPSIALFENVTGLFNSDEGLFFNRVLSDIHESGFNAQWQVISAREFGAPHLRKRVWIIAYPQSKRWKNVKNLSGIKRQNQVFNKTTVFSSLARGCVSADAEILVDSWPRNSDGLPEGMDRLKCIGNAIVPQIAAYLWGLIKAVI